YESHKFNQETDHLDKDDIVVLYTDGVIEATSKENELYGEERFLNILRSCPSENVEDILNFVLVDLEKFQGENQFDDITLLLLKRKI
ncbi:MAG: PP2C family protein-serine/threonine phosphatase, partial [Candidatus Cloacimonadota bacterium]|nr:PP2C family protein-serine/threonine phosphatase [Candidatus Cloacimonadota bacterium]